LILKLGSKVPREKTRKASARRVSSERSRAPKVYKSFDKNFEIVNLEIEQ
jgi:hypothetical protein